MSNGPTKKKMVGFANVASLRPSFKSRKNRGIFGFHLSRSEEGVNPTPRVLVVEFRSLSGEPRIWLLFFVWLPFEPNQKY